jgi:hypothetical protein
LAFFETKPENSQDFNGGNFLGNPKMIPSVGSPAMGGGSLILMPRILG